jgi:hypothetical protein
MKQTFELPDPKTGRCRLLPSKLEIGPNTLEDSFLATDEGMQSSRWEPDLPDKWYCLPGRYLTDGESFAVLLCFSSSKLVSISLSLGDGNGDDSSSWSTWSEKNELEKNRRQLGILQRRYGSPSCQFSWGKIWSEYDPRGGSSSIGIEYTKTIVNPILKS